MRVARVLALEALVGHQSWGAAVRGHAMGRWRGRRLVGGVGSCKSGMKSNFHANSSSPSVAGPGDVGSAKALADDLQGGRRKGRGGAMLARQRRGRRAVWCLRERAAGTEGEVVVEFAVRCPVLWVCG
jgi:hypothetical protein